MRVINPNLFSSSTQQTKKIIKTLLWFPSLIFMESNKRSSCFKFSAVQLQILESPRKNGKHMSKLQVLCY